jgi:arginyl-tRNA synthetase
LNFVTNKAILVEQIIKQVFAAGDSWGNTASIGDGKTVIVEYSSPNIAKPFHAGHLRSTIIGNFLKNLHKMLGYKTIAINYLGDWGKQYGTPSFSVTLFLLHQSHFLI